MVLHIPRVGGIKRKKTSHLTITLRCSEMASYKDQEEGGH